MLFSAEEKDKEEPKEGEGEAAKEGEGEGEEPKPAEDGAEEGGEAVAVTVDVTVEAGEEGRGGGVPVIIAEIKVSFCWDIIIVGQLGPYFSIALLIIIIKCVS